jgi:plasmid stabilization system protein ParE
MYRTIILPQAKTDIRNAVIWYENRQGKLGKRFIFEVRGCINRLNSNPYLFQIRYDYIRTAVVKSFPFLIHYTIDEDSKNVIIVSVFHTSMNPENWKDRDKSITNDQNPIK